MKTNSSFHAAGEVATTLNAGRTPNLTAGGDRNRTRRHHNDIRDAQTYLHHEFSRLDAMA